MSRPFTARCADGYVLQGTRFDAAAPDRGVTVIVCPAILVRDRFYHAFASHIAGRGFRVITFANRGMGLSLAAETRRWAHALRHWGERDLPAVVAWARSSAPDHRLYVVGHSMGGQTVALSEAVHALDGIVTVAATAAWWGHWPVPARFGLLAFYGLVPVLGRAFPTVPADRAGLGPDIRGSLLRDWARWGRHPAYLDGPFGHRSEMARYRGRLLITSFTDDRLGTRRAVEVLHRGYTAAEREHRHIDPVDVGVRHLGHFGWFRRHPANQLWEQAIAWMERDRVRARRR